MFDADDFDVIDERDVRSNGSNRQRPRRKAFRPEEEQEEDERQPVAPLREGTVVTLDKLLAREDWSLTRIDNAVRAKQLKHMQGRSAYSVLKEIR